MKNKLCLSVVMLLSLTSSAFAANKANDQMLSLSPSQQASMLGGAVGQDCTGTKALYMGMSKKGASKDQAFWSLRCANKKKYVVQINPDAHGSTKVLTCGKFESLKLGKCFQTFSNQ
jgi:hypothetical protein